MKAALLKREVVGVDAVGRERGKYTLNSAERGETSRLLQMPESTGILAFDTRFQVCQQVVPRQQRKSALDLEMGARGVDEQDIEKEQAQKGLRDHTR